MPSRDRAHIPCSAHRQFWYWFPLQSHPHAGPLVWSCCHETGSSAENTSNGTWTGLICPTWQIKFFHSAAANQPGGQSLLIIRNGVKPPKSKIFLFSSDPNQFTDSLSRPTRGAIARRHERGAGCGGRESVRRATAIAGRDEPRERCAACRMIGAFLRVVLAPVAGAKFAEARRPDRADKTLIRG